uniref:Z1 domain-containing protein n=1 Tax=Marinobacterium profundum TaxID=1714300 RepID=UPI00083580D1|nr:Z1 domain-containing protein [Marinobacterium profundum]
MREEVQDLKDMISALLAKRLPTPEMIREHIQRVRAVYPSVTDEEAEKLALDFETVHGVTMNIGATLENTGFEKWLDEARSDIDFYFWNRYRRLLGEKGFSAHVLATLDNITDRILGLLQRPLKEGKWDRRGMVVGHVQSGKTANYTGLICKAADAGYEVIIVIAGLHNNLRSQTQMRLDEGFIGFDSAKLQSNKQGADSVIGVGRYDSTRRPNAFTNTFRDFNKATATSIGIPLENLKQPAVFVIKKNTSTLKNLLEWLKEHNARRGASSISAPMLLIDDEADNASINIKKGGEEVSRINGQIRQLLDIFDRSCYIGYTATPFANIFIDPANDDEMFGADLFPRDFIVSLDPPDNYFGASRVFLNDIDDEGGNPIVRHIDDNGDLLPLKHLKGHVVHGLPASLQRAVRAFILARAIRLVRGQVGKHNSMLVNASRFTDVQKQLRNEIHVFVDRIRGNIRVNGLKPEKEALLDIEIAALHDVFLQEYQEECGFSWLVVQEMLWESVSPINVVEVNSRSSGSLDYAENEKSGLNLIAVGGFSLSRGLTLEGLMVSYFLRNSMMYDTLMQMGRWFGYRPGYDDLCRVWMPEEAEGWYAHIAESIEELRDELRSMEVANATPEQFGLKVRSHPDTLIVTARNKMGSSERLVVSVGLANQFVETAVLRRDTESILSNRKAAVSLVENLRSSNLAPENSTVVGGGRLVNCVPVSHILEFLESFRNHPGSYLTETDPVRKYIEDRMYNELSNWDFYIPGVKNMSDKSCIYEGFGFEFVCQRRREGRPREGKVIDEKTLFISDKQRVSSRGIESIGLSPEEIESAKASYRNDIVWTGKNETLNYPDRIFRRIRKRPLLVLHMLAIGAKEDDLSHQEPTVAWSISFPKTEYEEKKVEYVVNTTWFRERYQEEADEDEEEGDND